MCIRDRLGVGHSLAEDRPGAIINQTGQVFRAVGVYQPALDRELLEGCLLYTSDAADERSSVDLGGRRIIKKKKSESVAWIKACKKKETYYTLQ